jgi:hypothetical protein
MKQIGYLYLALMAFLVDVVTFAASHLVLPALVPVMQQKGGTSALVLGGAFLLFVAGVFVFRKMQTTPHGDETWLSRGWRTALALLFAFVISLGLAWQLGFFDSGLVLDTRQMGEGGSMSYFVFGPGAWLAFSLLYVLVFAFNVTPSIAYGGAGYALAALFGLVATDAMLIVFVAQARAVLLEMGAPWWWVLLALLLLILLFGPPRLLYVSRTIGLRSPPAYIVVALFLLVLGVYATQMIITMF